MAAAFIVMMALIAATPAEAQDRPAGVNFGGGWTFPVSGLNDAFDIGWNAGIGGTFNISPTVGFQAEYMYHRMGGPDRPILIASNPDLPATTSGIIESNHQIHSGTFNLVYQTPRGGSAVGGYVLGGVGIYHRLVQLTTPSVGYTTICDPYWYVCYPTLVSVDRIIGDRSSNDFGINIGGGVTFGTDGQFYVEMRYHYVWGPKVETQVNPLNGTDVCPNECSTNAQYFPLTLGFRW
ncbi:MAG TPA: outer membrane beta-barrel protein [Vicinamibacterales bacterium]|jgi:opacity protein-like surface antigen|nr:outer membrane beta-barrel protein [Vicinamibacterales bacterium]